MSTQAHPNDMEPSIVVELAPADNPEIEETTNKIAETLDESVIPQLRQVVYVMGQEKSLQLMEESVTIQNNGGMPTKNGKRQRTLGGIFFQLARRDASEEQRKQIFSFQAKRTMGIETPKDRTKIRPIEMPLDWEVANQVIQRVVSLAVGKASIVKITLSGRPKQAVKAKTCMVIAMQGGRPTSGFPKGLPRIPDGNQRFVVFIGLKQWRKANYSLTVNQDDELVVEGYPIFDAKKQITVILARNVTTKYLQRIHTK